MTENRLPIKIVKSKDSDFFVPKTNGGEKKFFHPVTPELRSELITQLSNLENVFASSFSSQPEIPAVAKVVLRREALAKSHRPTHLLSEKTTPIFGAGQFGELFTTVTQQGLAKLKTKISQDQTIAGKANISTIQKIEPYTIDAAEIVLTVAKVNDGVTKLKVKLFRHGNSILNDAILAGFYSKCKQLNLTVTPLNYGRLMTVFKVSNLTSESVSALCLFSGIQTVSEFQEFHTVRHLSHDTGSADDSNFGPPRANVDYPVVGLVDSGTHEADSLLSPWREDRFCYVIPSEMDHRHGSFVAGLTVFPRALHGGDTRFPGTSAKIIDIVALPGNHSSSHGKISEEEALEILGESLTKFRKPKIWNLSFGSNDPISDNRFSDFAVALDSLQDEFGVTFVIAGGNLQKAPFRAWPPLEELNGIDRLCAPADSVRAITVGSAAHRESLDTVSEEFCPSPFSRRGPGPVYLPKPELIHFGGNCEANGAFFGTGINSLDGSGNIVEAIGTSFSAPLVSNILANVHHMSSAPISKNLAKALMIQSAMLNAGELVENELHYKGFGIPSNVDAILNCQDWLATLVFEEELWQMHDFEKRSFPIPQCFRTADDKVKGEFLMTLVYDPPLDAQFGAEYCRSNIDISLGTYDPDATGAPHHSGKIPIEGGDFSEKFEEHLIQHGFKWSPIKVYRKSMGGISGQEWRLRVDLTHRANFIQAEPQKFAVVISMYDKNKILPVYTDVMAAMRAQGWATNDITLRNDVRLQI